MKMFYTILLVVSVLLSARAEMAVIVTVVFVLLFYMILRGGLKPEPEPKLNSKPNPKVKSKEENYYEALSCSEKYDYILSGLIYDNGILPEVVVQRAGKLAQCFRGLVDNNKKQLSELKEQMYYKHLPDDEKHTYIIDSIICWEIQQADAVRRIDALEAKFRGPSNKIKQQILDGQSLHAPEGSIPNDISSVMWADEEKKDEKQERKQSSEIVAQAERIKRSRQEKKQKKKQSSGIVAPVIAAIWLLFVVANYDNKDALSAAPAFLFACLAILGLLNPKWGKVYYSKKHTARGNVFVVNIMMFFLCFMLFSIALEESENRTEPSAGYHGVDPETGIDLRDVNVAVDNSAAAVIERGRQAQRAYEDKAKARSSDVSNGGTSIITNRFKLVTRIVGDHLLVSIDTDLPDEAEISLTVSRHYWEVGNSSAYQRDYFNSRETVGAWRKPRRISLDEQAWLADLRNFQAKMARIGAGMEFKVARIDDRINIYAVMHINQPDRRFGGRGNPNLKGSAVGDRGSVSAESYIRRPL